MGDLLAAGDAAAPARRLSVGARARLARRGPRAGAPALREARPRAATRLHEALPGAGPVRLGPRVGRLRTVGEPLLRRALATPSGRRSSPMAQSSRPGTWSLRRSPWPPLPDPSAGSRSSSATRSSPRWRPPAATSAPPPGCSGSPRARCTRSCMRWGCGSARRVDTAAAVPTGGTTDGTEPRPRVGEAEHSPPPARKPVRQRRGEGGTGRAPRR